MNIPSYNQTTPQQAQNQALQRPFFHHEIEDPLEKANRQIADLDQQIRWKDQVIDAWERSNHSDKARIVALEGQLRVLQKDGARLDAMCYNDWHVWRDTSAMNQWKIGHTHRNNGFTHIVSTAETLRAALDGALQVWEEKRK